MGRLGVCSALFFVALAATGGSRAQAQAPDAATGALRAPPVPDAYLADAPALPPPARIETDWPLRTRRRAQVHLATEGTRVTLHIGTPSGWSELCTVPCDVVLPRGPVLLAASTRESPAPVPIEGSALRIDLDEALLVRRDDNARLRGGGMVLVVLGLVLAAGFGGGMLAAHDEAQASGLVVASALSVVGTVVGFAGGALAVGTGVVFAATPDATRIERSRRDESADE